MWKNEEPPQLNFSAPPPHLLLGKVNYSFEGCTGFGIFRDSYGFFRDFLGLLGFLGFLEIFREFLEIFLDFWDFLGIF